MNFEDILNGLKNDLDNGQNRISQEELEAQKVDPKDVRLPAMTADRRQVNDIQLPEVQPPSTDRIGRKLASQERIRQWEMKRKFLRTVAVNESIAAVNVHALNLMDRAQELMMDNLYGRKRRDLMNEFMASFTAQCLQLTRSEVLAVIESYLKRIAENL